MIVGGNLTLLVELHHPIDEEAEWWYDSPGHAERYPECEQLVAGGGTCEGHTDKVQVCEECGYEHDGDTVVFRPWPCPTRRALDELTAWTAAGIAHDEARLLAGDDPAVFACPRCGTVSHSALDAANGYCARCRWWTGSLLLGTPDVIAAAEAAGKIEPLAASHGAVIVLAHGDSCQSCRHLIPRSIQ